MSIHATYKKHILKFKKAVKTSRDQLYEKPTYFISIHDSDKGITATGECSTIKGLSIDNESILESKIDEICTEINQSQSLSPKSDLSDFPAVRCGLEIALIELEKGGNGILYETDFTLNKKGIPINGLIWMGDLAFMKKQVVEKLESGYSCLKLKIGDHNFEDELDLIRKIRKEFTARELLLRADANGAFNNNEALEKLKRLSNLDLHSIEQPIFAGQLDEMAKLCEKTPLPVCLDEELIGVQDKLRLLNHIKPQYIILKPSLLGGFEESNSWIKLAEERNVGWWATSALESNIGLSAIAQWVSTYPVNIHQGLGTGQLYSNNIPSDLRISRGYLYFS